MKRLRLFFLLMFLLSAPLIGAPTNPSPSVGDYFAVSNSGNEIQLKFALPDFRRDQTFQDGQSYDTYSIENESQLSVAGYPELPYISRLVLVPLHGSVELEVESVTSVKDENIHPQTASDGEVSSSSIRKGTSEYLKCTGFWPPEPVVIEKPMIMRGYRIVKVTLFPFQHNSATGELKINREMNVNLKCEGSQVAVPDRRLMTPTFQRIVNSIVSNPIDPKRDDPVQNGSIVYVTGEWDAVIDALQPLLEWRKRSGQQAELMILENPTDAEDVKNALQEAYNEWDIPPEYIALVGNARDYFVVGCFDERDGAGYAYETDHHFGEFEGDDILPEAAVGRIVFGDDNNLEGIVAKIIQYESDPYLGEDDEAGWQLRGAVSATDARSGLSCIDMSKWTRNVLLDNGFEQVNEFYWTGEEPERNPTQFFQEEFRDGINYLTYRGWMQMNGFGNYGPSNLQNGRMLPFVILATCNTGDYLDHFWGLSWIENFLMNPNGGAIGAVGAAGATHTPYNNLTIAGITRGIFIEDITTQGWATMRGKLDLYRNYAGFGDIDHPENANQESWLTSTYIYNLMGDPATDLFTAVPRELSVEHSDILNEGDSYLNVQVTFADDEQPAAGVRVCLYEPDNFQLVEFTDDDGEVTFGIDPALLDADGTVMLTLTGHNLVPYLADLEIVEPESFIGSASFEFQDGDDEVANPGELLDLEIEIMNYGENFPEGQLTATLTAGNPNLEVLEGEFQADAAPEPGNSLFADFEVGIGGAFPNGKDARFDLTVVVGEESWRSSVNIPVSGAVFTLEQLEWNGDPLVPGDMTDLRIEIRNIGDARSPVLHANLVCHTPTIEIIFPDADYDAAPSGETTMNGEDFRISANIMHLPGSLAEFALELESDNGFVDTVYFSFPVGQAGENDPFGTDDYGYACFDNTDVGWMLCPGFDWIEIDPEERGPGEDTDLFDRVEEGDESVLVDLPFVFRYYGEEFDEITICTNGWLAMGNQSHLITGRNRRIPSGMVASGMICPFWNDLITPQHGGIYTYFDEDRHVFIIEWSKVRRLSPDGNQEPRLSFQVILHDPDFHPSLTGDSDIIFQYLEIEDTRQCFHWDTPFATVGIASPDMLDGLQYSYWNILHDGAAPLENERAIKFTTNLGNFDLGMISGVVRAADNNAPIQGVRISTNQGVWGISDEDGEYLIENVVVDPLYPVTLFINKEFWTPQLIEDVDVVADDVVEIDISMIRPEFSISRESLCFQVKPDSSAEINLTLENQGQGELTFSGKVIPYELNALVNENRDDSDDEWDLIQRINISDATDDFRIGGIVWADGYWVVSGSSLDEDECRFYIFNKEGEFLESLVQPQFESRYGIRDMVYYNGIIYGTASASDFMVGIDLTNDEVIQIPLPDVAQNTRAMTIDPLTGYFYVCSITNSIYELRLEGDHFERLRSLENQYPGGGDLRKYGLAWYNDDPDNHPLYIMTSLPDDDNDAPDIQLYKMNPADENLLLVSEFAELDANYAGKGGISVSTGWHFSTTVFAAILNHPDGDEAFIYELGFNSSWVDFSPRADTLAGGVSLDIPFIFNSAAFDTGRYEFAVQFDHNAEPGRTIIPVIMQVTKYLDMPDVNQGNEPLEWSLDQNYPNPFNPVTEIRFSLKTGGAADLAIYDLAGRRIAQLVSEQLEAGYHSVTFNAEKLPGGVYFYRLNAGSFKQTKKMILIK